MKKLLLVLLLGLASNLWSAATYSRVKTWSSGETLTASDLNAEFNNILTNGTPAGLDDYSATTTEMQAVTDPYPGSVESQATSLQGELERLRYQLLQIENAINGGANSYWYQDAPASGMFTIATSSVGVNDTTPDATLDVAGTLRVDGASTLTGAVAMGGAATVATTLGVTGDITSDGNITTTGVDVDFSTHVAIAGNLSVSGAVSFSQMSSVVVYATATFTGAFPSGASTVVSQMSTESEDTLSEWNGSTFTATYAGTYAVTSCLASSGAGVLQYAAVKNGATIAGPDGDFIQAYTNDNGGCLSGSFVLAAGDTISFKVYQFTGSPDNIIHGSGASIWRIR